MNALSKTATLAAALACGGPAQAAVYTLDFSRYASGPVANSIYGATFALRDSVLATAPLAVDLGMGMALTNTDGNAPYTRLMIGFAVPASNISFRFENYAALPTASTVGAFDSDDNRLAQVGLGTDSVLFDPGAGFARLMSLDASNVSYLIFNNGYYENAIGYRNNAFGIGFLRYTKSR